MVAGFAGDFVNAFPGGFFLIGRFGAGKIYFHFEAIEGTTESDAAGNARSMAMETVFTGRDDGGLELQDGFIAEAGGVGEITGGTTDGSDQTFVGVHQERNLMRQSRHG